MSDGTKIYNVVDLADLTTNGFVKTTSSDGTLIVDPTVYLASSSASTLYVNVAGSVTGAVTQEQGFLNSVVLNGIRVNVQTKTATYTATTTDNVVVCNSTAAITINLPIASGRGQSYAIKNINSGSVTVDPDGGDTIDNEPTMVLGQYDCIQLVDSSANKWSII